jgi:hypothetical protein
MEMEVRIDDLMDRVELRADRMGVQMDRIIALALESKCRLEPRGPILRPQD